MWEEKIKPKDGTWCWVTDGEDISIAKRFSKHPEGWINGDNWSNFDEEIIGWMIIKTPEEISREHFELQLNEQRTKKNFKKLI